MEFITECYDQVTPSVAEVPATEPGCSFVLKCQSPIRAVCRDLTSSFENASPNDIFSNPLSSMNCKEKAIQES